MYYTYTDVHSYRMYIFCQMYMHIHFSCSIHTGIVAFHADMYTRADMSYMHTRAYMYVCHVFIDIHVSCTSFHVCCSVLQCFAVCCSVLQYLTNTLSLVYTRPHPETRTESEQTHCNTLQHTATLRHTATHCNTQQHTATVIPQPQYWNPTSSLQHTASKCRTLQHTATHCNTLQHTAKYCNCHTLASILRPNKLTATHCNTLQHTATHCNCHTPASILRPDQEQCMRMGYQGVIAKPIAVKAFASQVLGCLRVWERQR